MSLRNELWQDHEDIGDGGDDDWEYLWSQTRDTERTVWDQVEKIFSGQEKLVRHLEAQEKELNLREQQLEQEEAQIHSERMQLICDKELNEDIALIRKKNSENMLLLVEEQKRENEKLHKKVARLENLVEAKEALELAIERMHEALEVMDHADTEDENKDLKKKMDELHEQLEKKEEDLELIKQLNYDLIIKERTNNDELHQARMELIKGLSESKAFGGAFIGLKTLGDLESKPFLAATKRKFSDKEAEDKALELRLLWDSHLRDLSWEPFKSIPHQGEFKKIVDEDDEKLKSLKNEYGEEVHNAVVTALEELNEYNPEGRCAVMVPWNFKEDRKASLKEGLKFLLKQCKWHKQRRNY